MSQKLRSPARSEIHFYSGGHAHSGHWTSTRRFSALPSFRAAGCSSQASNKEPTTASASETTDESGLQGHDLEIAEANCQAYETATEPTTAWHEKPSTGARITIGEWMDVYESGQAGLELAPAPTAPALNQAITSVSETYDVALAKLDHYTMATKMDDEMLAWEVAHSSVESLCDRLPDL